MNTSRSTVQIHPHREANAIATLTLAFAADPANRWCWPATGDFLAAFPAFARALGGRAFESESGFEVGDGAGVALWLPPGVEPDEAEMDAVMAGALRPEIAEDIGGVLEGMAEHHPREPHWYLPLIAADPNWIGQGLGARLMKHALRRCDEQGVAAYLESSNPRNISLYQRHGFKITGRIQSGSSPVMTPMLRPRS